MDKFPTSAHGKHKVVFVDVWGYDATVPTFAIELKTTSENFDPVVCTITVGHDVDQFTRSTIDELLWRHAKAKKLQVPNFPDFTAVLGPSVSHSLLRVDCPDSHTGLSRLAQRNSCTEGLFPLACTDVQPQVQKVQSENGLDPRLGLKLHVTQYCPGPQCLAIIPGQATFWLECRQDEMEKLMVKHNAEFNPTQFRPDATQRKEDTGSVVCEMKDEVLDRTTKKARVAYVERDRKDIKTLQEDGATIQCDLGKSRLSLVYKPGASREISEWLKTIALSLSRNVPGMLQVVPQRVYRAGAGAFQPRGGRSGGALPGEPERERQLLGQPGDVQLWSWQDCASSFLLASSGNTCTLSPTTLRTDLT